MNMKSTATAAAPAKLGREPRRTTPKIGHPRRGDINLVDFDPTVGHEIQKTRPAIIVQNDIANLLSSMTVVVPLTSKFNELPCSTKVILEPDQSGLSLRSAVLPNQIRSVSRQRLGKHLDRASAATMRAVDQALQISLGLTLQ